MKKGCHYRIETAETDFFGGKTRAQAAKRQKEILKARGVRGKIVKFCSSGGKPIKGMSSIAQWTIVGVTTGAILWFVLKK